MLRPSNELCREQRGNVLTGTIGPLQREHTIGGKLLGGSVRLRRLLGQDFSASAPTWWLPQLLKERRRAVLE